MSRKEEMRRTMGRTGREQGVALCSSSVPIITGPARSVSLDPHLYVRPCFCGPALPLPLLSYTEY